MRRLGRETAQARPRLLRATSLLPGPPAAPAHAHGPMRALPWSRERCACARVCRREVADEWRAIVLEACDLRLSGLSWAPSSPRMWPLLRAPSRAPPLGAVAPYRRFDGREEAPAPTKHAWGPVTRGRRRAGRARGRVWCGHAVPPAGPRMGGEAAPRARDTHPTPPTHPHLPARMRLPRASRCKKKAAVHGQAAARIMLAPPPRRSDAPAVPALCHARAARCSDRARGGPPCSRRRSTCAAAAARPSLWVR